MESGTLLHPLQNLFPLGIGRKPQITS